MKENFYYIVKDEFFDKFSEMGCTFKYNKSGNRPIFCCLKDSIIGGLFWAIPTSKAEGKDLTRFNQYVSLDEHDIRSCYYHLGYTNRKAIFCISSVFPIIDCYIERAYTSGGQPLEMRREKMKQEIVKKLKRILTYENQFPNKLEQKITMVKKALISELGGTTNA